MKARAMRVTMYAPHDLSPTTVIMLESDITVSLDELAASTVRGAPGIFYVFDQFETEDDILRATIHGQERVREEEERNMAILYYWTTGPALKQVKPSGVLVMPKPAPLTKSDIEPVMELVRKHRAYQGQRILITTADHELLEFTGDGKVKVTSVPTA